MLMLILSREGEIDVKIMMRRYSKLMKKMYELIDIIDLAKKVTFELALYIIFVHELIEFLL